MTITEAELRSALGSRLRDLCGWLAGALEFGELRDKQSVNAAKEAFLREANKCWDRDSGDREGALTIALETFVESALSWADESRNLEKDLSLSANPAWGLTEFNLLVASALADKALLAFERGTKKHMMLAAMLYADAIEAREAWDRMRGPAGARNSDTQLGRLQQAMRALDEEVAVKKGRTLTAKKAAKAKLENDPTQAAKAEAHKLWLAWQAGETIYANQSDFCRHVCERLDLKDVGNVGTWCRRWKKLLVSEQT